MTELLFHEYANIFPLMTPEEYAALVADMRANGYDPTAPIVLYEGQILDGRNRWKAARELGIEPPYVDYDGDDPLGYVVRRNLNRRHLNETQRGTVASKLANIKRGGIRDGNPRHVHQTANLQFDGRISQTQAADMLNVSPRRWRAG